MPDHYDALRNPRSRGARARAGAALPEIVARAMTAPAGRKHLEGVEIA